ncbi:MAG TPA: family 14 glycosylhydrolase [Tepidisphaeraceae bacterium]|jgi:hypothetical protein
MTNSRRLAIALILMCLTRRTFCGDIPAPATTSTTAPTTRNAFTASWSVTPGAYEEDNLHLLSGGDGVNARDEIAGQPCVSVATKIKGASYLYFDVDDNLKPTGPLYATLQYLDQQFGILPTIQYDSKNGDETLDAYQAAEDHAAAPAIGSRTWNTAVYELRNPRFANRQNLRADLRITGGKPIIRSLKISPSKPDLWSQLAAGAAIEPAVKIGAHQQLIIGGFDPTSDKDAAFHAKALERAMPALKALGVTSHEVYVRWNLCEREPGKWDFSVYDRFVDVYRRHGMKWVPFLICGSAYSLPDWYHQKFGSQGYVCVEHNEESDVQSLWNPAMRQHVADFIKAFCDHYRDTGTIESILLGVTGNYGEAIYPATGNDWTSGVHGKYHTHPGYWANDPFAVTSFRDWLTAKYGASPKLRRAWGENAREINMIRPFLQKDAPSDRAWIDFVDWYQQSMTDYAQFWISETRKNFPRGDIYLCTGGHAPPEHGADFGEQCRIAALSGAGVRITNEDSDYANNCSITRWVASASRHYNNYFSYEPAAQVDARGVVARIYNATASGARGLHYYYGNLFDSPAQTQAFLRWGSEWKQRDPITEIAVYYPSTWIKLNTSMPFLHQAAKLRDRFDFAYLSDRQVLDGGLKKVQALVFLVGNTIEARTLDEITKAQKNGLLILYATGIGRPRTVEGDESSAEQLFGDPMLKAGNVAIFDGDPKLPEYRDFICQSLLKSRQLSPATRAMVTLDGKENNLFATLISPTQLLWFNDNAQAQSAGGNTLAPYSIAAQDIRP